MSKDSDSKVFAFLGVFLTIIGWLIVYLTRRKDKYAMYYAKQGLVLFIAWAIAGIITRIPFVGFFGTILGIIVFAFWVVGIVYSLSGKEKDIPLIGEFAKKF